MIKETMGQRIQKLRQYRKWTSQRLAVEVGVDCTTVRRWEDDRFPPKDKSLKALAKVFGVTEQFLLFGEGTACASCIDVSGLLVTQIAISNMVLILSLRFVAQQLTMRI